ncbi:unnamed protein product [Nyctereutes procyonoides]|uniref:(raccoon dog) hypothetical protein n=1 Tax=Nyctereutes procyonoides TaxID=34880 RepID=A0A811YPD3_NYCPR|nr:unnamed protein product [Nyctereutes procyonoides]
MSSAAENGDATPGKQNEEKKLIKRLIGYTVGNLTSKPDRDVLMQDFYVVESMFLPSEGDNLTPAHHYPDFRFKTYASLAFRYFRELFGIRPDDYLYSICSEPLIELSNPGASGSLFFVTSDDEFIIKTVQHKEAEFLQKLLPGYYMNLNQNPRTLLPKFYGLYCMQSGGINIRIVVMNNILPRSMRMHFTYDLKGSTYKQRASRKEREKSNPTFKDLDFLQDMHEGLYFDAETYNALMKTLQRDCRVLESFKIMDHSLLLGIHILDHTLKEKEEENSQNVPDTKRSGMQRVLYSTAMESIQGSRILPRTSGYSDQWQNFTLFIIGETRQEKSNSPQKQRVIRVYNLKIISPQSWRHPNSGLQVTLQSYSDQNITHQVPCMEPASPSACVSASLSLSLSEK